MQSPNYGREKLKVVFMVSGETFFLQRFIVKNGNGISKKLLQKKVISYQARFLSHHLILKLSLGVVRTNFLTFIMREEEG